MCGITGFWDIIQQNHRDEIPVIIQNMSDTLIHRGPDDAGIWVDIEAGIALGHRRLSIVDLSPLGHQPMMSANGRYIIIFNGEIYNFLELRQELEKLGHHFRGNSDTEVMLASLVTWGLERAIKSFRGMFAFALWDRQEQVLHLGRDRLGEKPLYYGWVGNTFVFGSELKALQPYPGWEGEIDRNILTLFLRYNYIPEPYSIYQGIYKLLPGTTLSLSKADVRVLPQPVTYWSAKSVAESGLVNPFCSSDAQAIEHLDYLLRDAVRLQMVADVPLGAFLSGGVDSSTVVALMQAQSSKPIKTFSIGFHEDAYNEAHYAKAVAQHLQTDHTELYVNPQEALDVIPKLPTLYDEPFADSSQIPTFLVAQLARQHVTVSLSGDGGDELFAGYNRYFWGRKIWQQIGWIPPVVRDLAARTLTTISPQAWQRGFAVSNSLLSNKIKLPQFGDKLHKLAEILAVETPEAMYRQLISHWKNPEALVQGATEPSTPLTDYQGLAELPDFTQRMMYLDMVTYLPGDILTKVDRATMGISLESRIPFLDPRVIEFAWQVPLSQKIRNGQGKWLLRQVLYKYVPSNLIERPKMGFGVPIDQWLRGSLRDWAETLLNEHRLKQDGFLNPQPIRQKWTEHLSGDRNWQYYLWNILIFQAWLEQSTSLSGKVHP